MHPGAPVLDVLSAQWSWPSGPWLGQVGTRLGQVVPLQGRWAVWGWGAGVTQACLRSAGDCNETCGSVFIIHGHVAMAGEQGLLCAALRAPESRESQAGDPAAWAHSLLLPPVSSPWRSSLCDHLSLAPLVGALAGCSSVGAEQVLDHHSLLGPWTSPSPSGLGFLL